MGSIGGLMWAVVGLGVDVYLCDVNGGWKLGCRWVNFGACLRV